MISLSTITQNTAGSIIIEESLKSNLHKNTARIVSVPTLDGGAVLVSSGVSDTDRSFLVKAYVSKAQAAQLWALFNAGETLLMSAPSGLFLVSIKQLATDNGNLSMSLLISNKEN